MNHVAQLPPRWKTIAIEDLESAKGIVERLNRSSLFEGFEPYGALLIDYLNGVKDILETEANG